MKYFYLIPQGGLCDILTKINQALKYCIESDRKLFIDTRYGRYGRNIFKYITFNHDLIIQDFDYFKKIKLDNLSVYPKELKNKFKNILNKKNIKITYNAPKIYSINNVQLIFPDLETSEDIIIYSNHGGSKDIFIFFNQYITLKDKIKNHCQKMIKNIKSKYLGIHIRNTDRKINIQKLYNIHKELFKKYEYIYLATDDVNSINFLKSLNLNIININSWSSDNNNISFEKKFKDLFFDIYAILNASQVLLKSKGGFSRLLRHSYENKNLVLQKFE